MRRQAYTDAPQAIHQPWRNMTGLYLAKVLSVDPATATCGVEMTEGSQPAVAHVLSPNANGQTGWVWLPQVNDLVVLGFMDKNSSMPVILGSVYAKNDTLHAQNPGDMILRHQSGSYITIATDGTVTLTQKAGAFLTMRPSGDIEAKHATSNADLLLDANGVTASQGTVKAQVQSAKVTLDANSGAGGAKVEIFPDGHINITPGGSGIVNVGGGTTFVARDGDHTSSPIGGGVADHYHLVLSTSTKVVAG